MEHPSEFSVDDVMNMQSLMDKLSKMSISNINKHHPKTMKYYIHSVWYGEDIIIGPNVSFHMCNIVSIFL